MAISGILGQVNDYVNKSASYVNTIQGAQKLAKIPKAAIGVLSAVGLVTPGLSNLATLCGSVDDGAKVISAGQSLNNVGKHRANIWYYPWYEKCLLIGGVMEGALVLIKLNVLPTTKHLFTYAGRITLFKNLGEKICSMSNGKVICEKLFALTSLEMIKNYVFLASAGIAVKALWLNKPSNDEQIKIQRNNWIKEGCKVAGVLTGTALFLGFVDSDKKKAVAFSILTTTSLIGYHLGVTSHKPSAAA